MLQNLDLCELFNKTEPIVEDSRKGKPFKETLLHRLGFDELQQAYKFERFLRKLNRVLTREFSKFTMREDTSLEIVIIAPYYVKVAEEMPEMMRKGLRTSGRFTVEPQTLEEHLRSKDGKPLFQAAIYYVHHFYRGKLTLCRFH